MTIVYLIKNLLDEKGKGKTISLDELDKLDEANVYNVRIDCEKNIDKKYKVGLTSKEVQLIVDSGIYKEIKKFIFKRYITEFKN